MRKNEYTTEYFHKRDLLIPHLADYIRSLAKTNNIQRILDVGCGTGLLVNYLNKRNFYAYGCDLSKEAVKIGHKRDKKGRILLASATALPYKNNSFQMITAISIIEHLNQIDAVKFVKEARRVLKNDGYIFMVTPNYSSIFRLIQGKNWFGYSDPTHINFFTPRSLEQLLVKTGFYKVKNRFKIKYQKSLDWEFPKPLNNSPKFLKSFAVNLLYDSPLTFIRNGFWIQAQKK